MLPFNPKPSTIMHLDLNSCFATIEQQANPLLRGRPMAVAAYTTASGCIIAPSVEAKKLGIKVGMRVKEGKLLCPSLLVLPPDLPKYRHVHLKMKSLLEIYTDRVVPKSIDEFVLDLESSRALEIGIVKTAREIKKRIKEAIGDWLTVSVGIAPNRFLAKLGSSLHKPDGLDEINKDNYLKIYQKLHLNDLCGIKLRNTIRLNKMGIYTVLDFYQADIVGLKAAFASICGYYWYLRLHGWEIDDVVFARRSYGNSFALPKPYSQLEELAPILSKLTEKMGHRMRKAGFWAKGVHVSIVYRDFSFWHQGRTLTEPIFDSREIYKIAYKIMAHSPYRKPVRELAVSCFNLNKSESSQLDLFGNLEKRKKLVEAVDQINEKWGNFVLTPALMMGQDEVVIDRIAFGNVKELEEFSLDT